MNDIRALVFDIAVDGACHEPSPDGDIEAGDSVEPDALQQCWVESVAGGADECRFEFSSFEPSGNTQSEERRTTEGEFAVQQQHSQGLLDHFNSLHKSSGISSIPAVAEESGEIRGCAGSDAGQNLGYGAVGVA